MSHHHHPFAPLRAASRLLGPTVAPLYIREGLRGRGVTALTSKVGTSVSCLSPPTSVHFQLHLLLAQDLVPSQTSVPTPL